MNIVLVLACSVASLLIGWYVGRRLKVTQMQGDICIAIDQDEGVEYPFLRLNGSLDDIKSQEFVQFKVIVKTQSREK